MILVLLQNAWFHEPLPYPEWSPKWRYTWLYALARCRSGVRLRKLLGDDCYGNDSIAFDNASPKVGYGNPSIKFPADMVHIRKLLKNHNPDMLVCCGKEAGKAASEWSGSLIEVPHPASRVLTNSVYETVREWYLSQDSWPVRRLITVEKNQWHSAPHPARSQGVAA